MEVFDPQDLVPCKTQAERIAPPFIIAKAVDSPVPQASIDRFINLVKGQRSKDRVGD
jgi:hypothetical protein